MQIYPTDVSDDEWACVTPYLTRMTEDAPQRDHSLREVLNGLRWIVRAGAAWRLMPHDLPLWYTSQRWLKAGVCDAIVHDLRSCCGWPLGGRRSPRRPFSIAVPCGRPPQAARVPAMMGPNVAAARQCIPDAEARG
jgi:transposase